MRRNVTLSITVAWLAFAGCKDDNGSASRAAVASPVEPRVGACAGDGGQVTDPLSAPFFPREVAGYCLDTNSETKVFGDGSKLSIDDICAEAFNGECGAYKSNGLKRVVQLRYVESAGSSRSVEVYLSQFFSSEGAYATFTKRVIADGDPLETALHKLDAGAAGAIGIDRAYVWKGFYLAELRYANVKETVEPLKASSSDPLATMSKEIGKRLHGAPRLPAAAARLTTDNLVPMGILYAPKDVLGIEGAGPGATGFYKSGEKRYRALSITRDDVDQAKEVLKTFGNVRGAREEKGIGDGAYRVVLKDKEGGKLEWVVARSGKWIVGIGDEEFIVQPAMAPTEHDKICLSRQDKTNSLKTLLK